MPRGKLINDLTGQVFGRLTVLSKAHYNPRSRAWYWLCRCTCGTEKFILGPSLVGFPGTKSCGCLMRENRKRHTFIGLRRKESSL